MRCVLSTVLLAMALLASAADRTHEFVLDNGLKLVVQEDHRAHVAVVEIWYRVGAADEHDGITGVSHVLEHMMFKGTPTLGPGRLAALIAEHGGRDNAFTGADYTAYYQQWSAAHVAKSFELEADRMRNLLLDEAEFAKEIQVVLEERRLRTDDDPLSLAHEALAAAAFQTSAYRQPVIGWEADILNMTVADVRAWYARWYQPNNAIVVVVGDVDPQGIHALAKQHFGALARGKIDPAKPRPEVGQHGTKRVHLTSDNARFPYLVMGYKVPVLREVGTAAIEAWEIYALDVLAAVLAGDQAARLPSRLERGRAIAAEVSASVDPAARSTSLFFLDAVPTAASDLAAVEQALVDEIARLEREPPSEAELARIKTQVIADHVFERDSMQHQAATIGRLEAVGLGWRVRDEYVDAIRSVSAAQVAAVAARYLRPERLTVVYLVPGKAP